LYRRKAESGKPKPATSDQFKVAGYGSRLEQAENEFKDIEGQKFNRTKFSERLTSALPDELRSGLALRNDQAERNFINATLRRESGASISPAEFASAEKQYFPRPGDSQDVIEQKRRNRALVQASMKAEAGPAWEEVKKISETAMQDLENDQNEQALKWAQENPTDKRSAAILKKLGVKNASK